jgi:hypothetical protein
MRSVDKKQALLSQMSPADRSPSMTTPERHRPTTYTPPGTAEEAPPPCPAHLRFRWATFGKGRVQVAGDLLAALEKQALAEK